MGVSFELCIPSLLLLLTVSVATGQEQPVKYLDGTMKNETLGCSLEDEAVWYFNGTKLVDPVVANTGSLILIFTGERSKDKALTGKYECRANGNSSEQEATAVYYVYYPDQLLTANPILCANPGEVSVTVGFTVDWATIGIEQRTCFLLNSTSPELPRLSSNGRTAVSTVNFTGQALTVRLICPISGHTLESPKVTIQGNNTAECSSEPPPTSPDPTGIVVGVVVAGLVAAIVAAIVLAGVSVYCIRRRRQPAVCGGNVLHLYGDNLNPTVPYDNGLGQCAINGSTSTVTQVTGSNSSSTGSSTPAAVDPTASSSTGEPSTSITGEANNVSDNGVDDVGVKRPQSNTQPVQSPSPDSRTSGEPNPRNRTRLPPDGLGIESPPLSREVTLPSVRTDSMV